jgi:hypothetical protein
MSIEKILNDAGFKTVIGRDAVLDAIEKVADKNTKPLCSGYKVFPDGSECPGCPDCKKVNQVT